MFTGIVQEIGIVKTIKKRSSLREISVHAPESSRCLKKGDSVSVDGVCLTVIARTGEIFTVEVIQETLKKTTIGLWHPHQKINLELPLKFGDKISGHFVTGHVDAKGLIVKIKKQDKNHILTMRIPKNLKKFIVKNGSITINGVSLTIANVTTKNFGIHLIPFTEKNTNLGSVKEKDYVNIEIDILARYKYTKKYLKI